MRRALANLADRLFALQRRDKQILQCLSDAIAVFAAYGLAHTLNSIPLDEAVLFQGALLAVSTVLTLTLVGAYRAVVRYLTFGVSPHILVAAIISVGLLEVSSVVMGYGASQRLIVDYSCLLLLFFVLPRHLMRWLYESLNNGGREQVLIYGAGSSGRALAMALRRHSAYQLVGFVDEDPALQGAHILGLSVFSPAYLERAASKGVSRVLLAMPGAGVSRRREIIHALEPLGIAIQTVPDMGDIISGRASVNELRNVDVDDLLAREAVPPIPELIERDLRDRVVLVTGAGGSIGSELCRQIMLQQPRVLILYERSEHALYRIDAELRLLIAGMNSAPELLPVLGSVCDKGRLLSVLRSHSVSSLYHAAAYKHVPLVEANALAAVENNVLGTWYVGQAAIDAGVQSCVLISTDKAVRPTNVMGATKRLAELSIQALATKSPQTRFSIVRFGNVLGSSGSVVPLFRSQIEAGGPVTVTHPDVMRYFMTIPEAAQLVIQAGAMGAEGDVFLLDMGESVNILELARRMIRLSGYRYKTEDEPDGDIEIRITGLRPGEKLFEELLISDGATATDHPRIMRCREPALSLVQFENLLKDLLEAARSSDLSTVRRLFLDAPLHYQPEAPTMSDLALSGFKENVVRVPFKSRTS